MKKVMIAWVAYQRRADCMRDYWGYELKHIDTPYGKNIFGKVLDYFIKVIKTFSILISERPDQLWIQLPPSLLLHIAFVYKLILKKDCQIIADLHNSMLRKKWMKFPLARTLLNRMDVVLAHNRAVKEELEALGIKSEIVFVLEDYPFEYKSESDNKSPKRDEKYLIFPCSFDVDEPIMTVIRAAKLTDIKFYITGNDKKFVNPNNVEVPDNVIFTGYISKAKYDSLLLNASMVLGLTTRQNVQLSVANEGLSAGKPLILSNTRTLTELYADAAVFVDNDDPQALAETIDQVSENIAIMSERTRGLMVKRVERWKNQAEMVMSQ